MFYEKPYNHVTNSHITGKTIKTLENKGEMSFKGVTWLHGYMDIWLNGYKILRNFFRSLLS